VAEQLTPRREHPAFRIGAYTIFVVLLLSVLGPLGLGGWVLPIWVAVGLAESTITCRRAWKRHHPRRLGPRAEWID
jgi:hypothetical protein